MMGWVDNRTLPQDVDAEAAIIANIVLNGGMDVVGDILKPEHFYADQHRTIFGACVELYRDGIPIDLVTLKSKLADTNVLENCGGMSHLIDIVDRTPAIGNPQNYASIVIDKARLRKLIEVSSFAISEALQNPKDVQSFLEQQESATHLIAHNEGSNEDNSLSVIIEAEFNRISELSKTGEVPGITTGFKDLDKMTGGMYGGELYIVGGRPGMAKSSYAFNAAVKIAKKEKKGCIIFSLEMPKSQVAVRMACTEGCVDLGRVRRNMMTPDDWSHFTTAVNDLKNLPIVIDETCGIKPMALRSKTRRIKREWERKGIELGAVFVDYLQYMGAPDHMSSNSNTNTVITAISKSLKQLAKEMNIPVIALAQLNRAVESREDKRPMMSDIRDSGSIEQDADCILFIYRDEYYSPNDPSVKGLAELIIAKQRNGPVGTVNVAFDSSYTRFGDLCRQ